MNYEAWRNEVGGRGVYIAWGYDVIGSYYSAFCGDGGMQYANGIFLFPFKKNPVPYCKVDAKYSGIVRFFVPLFFLLI